MTDYPTPNMHAARLRSVRLIILHSTETPANTARSVAKAFQDPARRASAHWVIGTDGTFSGVPEESTAWAAPGANADGIQIEQCGYAGSTDWTTGDGAAVLAETARIVAGICQRWGIPCRALTNDEIAAGASGICTHAQISAVYKASDHWDPGPAYPMASLIALAQGGSLPAPSTLATLKGTTSMMIVQTRTPWGTDAYALIPELAEPTSLDRNQAQAYAGGIGVCNTVAWDYWNLLIREAWDRRRDLLTDFGIEVKETSAEAVARIVEEVRATR